MRGAQYALELSHETTEPTINLCERVLLFLERHFNGTAKFLMLSCAFIPLLAALQGCAGSSTVTPNPASESTESTPATSVQPSTASLQMWQQTQFTVSNAPSSGQCAWTSSQPTILNSLGGGSFQALAVGTAQVTVTCGSSTASASVTVSAQQQSGPIVITKGGTYSGDWVSGDPGTPAVTIHTDQPVVIQDSTITGPGDMIDLSGVSSGANVTIQNVTATALDPRVSGAERGAFLSAQLVASLTVKNCSVIGASFGVKLYNSSPSTLEISNNYASNLEDRASNGQGGFLDSRPALGHFVILNSVYAPGADISWNQIVQTIGQSSTEDVFNIYNSQGTQANPIKVHDNYMEGSSSPVVKGNYSGTALITDGTGTDGAQPTAFVVFQANQVVATAGTGIGIAAGHDITATANRIVSCGVSSSGTWYAWGANGIMIWNFYSNPAFYNNTITGTVGGLVGPGPNGTAIPFDVWVNPPDMLDPGNSVAGNNFTNPCLTPAGVNLQAEQTERTYWTTKTAGASELIGDQHVSQ
jgi:hypothetical protein